MPLRPYQEKLITDGKALLSHHKSVMLQLATGGGKTWIFSTITAMAIGKNNPVWIVVPRNELIYQASDTLTAMGIRHGIISAKSNESLAYNVHVVSKDTLLRRVKADKIKNWPVLIIFDEAHLALDQQLFIRDQSPDSTRFLGFTATPERLDGRGLDDMYQAISYGPTIKDLVEIDYLSDVRYFSIPGFNPNELTSKDFSGTEVKQDVLDNILKQRQIYGSAIAHYRKYAHNKACIVFCRSVKAAAETAQRFRDSGYKFESIDGSMTDSKRKALINGLKDGRLHGLTSCDLICYGLDVPKVECIIKLRFTLSKALDSQMNGRGLRPYPGKESCIILDHVGAIFEHGHPLADYEWQFHGREKRRKKKGVDVAAIKLCPECFMYFDGDRCPNCGAEKSKQRKPLKEVDGRLIEIEGPIKLQDRPAEERREIQDKIGSLIDENKEEIKPGAIGELLKIAESLGRNAMWVYWKLSEGMRVVNIPLLHEIRRQRGYKSGWVWMQQKTISERLGR